MVLMGLVSVPGWLHRWLWFAALYAAGVGTLAVVAYGLGALLKVLGEDADRSALSTEDEAQKTWTYRLAGHLSRERSIPLIRGSAADGPDRSTGNAGGNEH